MLSACINDEVPNQSFRFHFPTDMTKWSDHLDQIDTYLRGRNQSMEMQIEAFLDVFSYEAPVGYAAYPNPFNDEIHIMVSSDKWQTQELMVFDLMGRCLYSESLRLFDGVNHFTIHPDLASGVYVMRIGNQVQRIVKY